MSRKNNGKRRIKGDPDARRAVEDIESLTDEWAEGYASQFDPRDWESKDAHELRRKACSEAAMYLLQAHNAPGASVDAPKLHEVVVDAANDPLMYELLHREPMSVRSYGYTILYARDRGELSDPAVWDALGDKLGAASLRGVDRYPFETLDLWHMNRIYGREAVFDPDDVFRLSGLRFPTDFFHVDLEDIYPLTHHLMFHRGMGMAGYGFPDEPVPFDLETELCGLIFRFLGEDNYDATLELVLGGALHRQVPPDLVTAVLEVIRDVAEEEGKVPDYTIDDDSVDTISGEVDDVMGDLGEEAVDWGEHYHVNLVAGYTVRTVRAAWPELVAAYDDEHRPSYDRDQLAAFSDMVSAFANYDLKEGADRLVEVADRPIAEAFPDVFDEAVAFLEDQRRSDGTFGYWAKEKLKFAAMGYDEDQFEPELVEPVSETCDRALRAVERGD